MYAQSKPPVQNRINSFTVLKFLALITIFLATMYFSYIGVIEFNSWSQVDDLHRSNLPLIYLSDHPHFYRYLISMPGLLASEYFGMNAFSVYISLFMFFSIYIMYSILRDRSDFVVFFGCACIFTAHLFMNGRGAISWFGWMIILKFLSSKETQINIKSIFIMLFSLLCCSVSSGTFTVAFLTVILFLAIHFLKNRNVSSVILLVVLLYIYSPLAIEGIERNLAYYSLGNKNPIVNMLEHGFGSIVEYSPIMVALIASLILIISTILLYSVNRKFAYWEFLCVLTPLFGGIFGYTTLTLAVPSIILVGFSRIGESRSQKPTLARAEAPLRPKFRY
ncbi:MAG: hypothetical protein KA312_02110 [Sphingorhabdus sp.]|nr:hypothetical protein [Sphingorhabdus sp.]